MNSLTRSSLRKSMQLLRVDIVKVISALTLFKLFLETIRSTLLLINGYKICKEILRSAYPSTKSMDVLAKNILGKKILRTTELYLLFGNYISTLKLLKLISEVMRVYGS